MRLSFGIATQDRREPLARAISSIEATKYADREIIVVDDASSDGTAAMLAADYPNVRVVRSDRPLGVGGARARALELANGDVFVSLDDDAWFVGTDVGEHIAERFIAIPDLAAACFRVEAPDGTIRRREIPRRDKRMPAENEELGYFLGGAVALRISALREVGGFPADTLYAAEEADISFRLVSAGYRIQFMPCVRVVHEAIPSVHNTVNREANYVRSHVALAARYLPTPYAQVHATAWIGQSLMSASADGHLAQTLAAAREALIGWGEARREGLILSRENVRRLTRLSARTWY